MWRLHYSLILLSVSIYGAGAFSLSKSNVACGAVVVPCCWQDFEVGDRVLVDFLGSEREGVVVDPDSHQGRVKVRIKVHGREITPFFSTRRISLLDPAEPNEDSSTETDDSSTEESRTWSDSTGKYKIEASLVENENGKVTLRKNGGRVVTLPIEKLSESDQKYLAELKRKAEIENDPDNPFSGGEKNPFAGGEELTRRKPVRRGRRPKRGASRTASKPSKRSVSPEFATNIIDVNVDKWAYRPDDGKKNSALKSIRYSVHSEENDFFNKASPLIVSLNRKMAATLVTNAFDKDLATLVIFDLENGKAETNARMPFRDGEIFAISNDGKKIATLPGGFRGNGGKFGLCIWSIDGTKTTLETHWSVSGGRRGGFSPESGYFIGDGRLLTIGKNAILWDIESESDLYTLENIDGPSVAFSANNRCFAAKRDDAIFLVDTQKGNVLGILELSDDKTAKTAFSQSGALLATLNASSGQVQIWDLSQQKVISEFLAPKNALKSMHWVGDQFVLMGGRSLIDVSLRAEVWEYSTIAKGSVSSTKDGRFWVLTDKILKSVEFQSAISTIVSAKSIPIAWLY